MGGTVYHIAAAVLGLDAKKDFIGRAEDIAAKTGAHLAPDMHCTPAAPWQPRPPMPAAALPTLRRRLSTCPPMMKPLRWMPCATPPPALIYWQSMPPRWACPCPPCFAILTLPPPGWCGLLLNSLTSGLHTSTPPAPRDGRAPGHHARRPPQDKPRFLARGSKQGLLCGLPRTFPA